MSVSRRNFIKGAIAGSGALVAGTAQAGGGAKHFAGHPGRFGLLHDTTRCVGCRSCEVACRLVNELPPAQEPVGDKTPFESRRRVTPTSLTVVNRYREPEAGRPAVYRKHQCMHCNEPCCASVCLVRAFSKTPEGPVLYDPSICMGCRYCVTACPYYALSYEYDDPLTPRVMRCTMCYPRIKQGKNPGCADACPTGAITFGKREDLIKVARSRIAKSPDRYIDHIFGEHEFGGTSWLTLAGVSFGELGLHEGATHTSLPEIGTEFLSVVPLVITIYPGLLMGFYAFSKRKDRLSEEQKKAAVVEALMKADEETKQKLAAAATKAGKDKEKAIAAAVKKALAEAEKAAASKEDGK
jgi:formate dehydrogenase iron-sulfur subunit